MRSDASKRWAVPVFLTMSLAVGVAPAVQAEPTSPTLSPTYLEPGSSPALTITYKLTTSSTGAWETGATFEAPAFTSPFTSYTAVAPTVSGSVITCNWTTSTPGVTATWTNATLASSITSDQFRDCYATTFNGRVRYALVSSEAINFSTAETVTMTISAGGLTAPTAEGSYDYSVYSYQNASPGDGPMDESAARIVVSSTAPDPEPEPTPTPAPQPAPAIPSVPGNVTVSLDPDGGACNISALTGEVGTWHGLPTASDCVKSRASLAGWQTRDLAQTFAPGAFVNLTSANTLVAVWKSHGVSTGVAAATNSQETTSKSAVIWRVNKGSSRTLTSGQPKELRGQRPVFTVVVRDPSNVTAEAIVQAEALAKQFGGTYAGVKKAASWRKPRIVAAYHKQ